MEFVITETRTKKRGMLVLIAKSVPEGIEAVILIGPNKLTLVGNKEILESNRMRLWKNENEQTAHADKEEQGTSN